MDFLMVVLSPGRPEAVQNRIFFKRIFQLHRMITVAEARPDGGTLRSGTAATRVSAKNIELNW